MSLQIWLPLNGNLENQGLQNVAVTNNGAVVNSNGKIGSCYQFGTNASDIQLPKETMTDFTTACSVTFWIKILSWNSAWATFFQAGPAGAPWVNYTFGFLRNGSSSKCCFTISDGSSASNASYQTSDLDLNVWYHVSLIYTTGQCLIYLNGVLEHSYSTSIVPNFKSINSIRIGRCNNGSSYQTNCLINDFRLYDHALSAKEVRELAKGLVLHYKLDDGYVEGTTNLVPYPKKTGTVSAAWDSTLHPDAITVSGWTNGYNHGVSNPETGYHAYWKTIENISTMVYNNINSDYGMKGRWMGISCSVSNVGINANDTYTISFDIKTTSKRQTAFPYVFGGWYYKRTSDATSRSFHDGYFYASNTKLGEWEHFSITKQRVSTYDNNGEYEAFYLYGQSSTEGTMYVRNFQVEKKDHSTPYAGSTGSRSASIVYDSSGFGYNGTPTNVETLTGSPRYLKSTHFTGSTSKIHIPNLLTSGFSTTYTFTWWGKTNSWSTKMFWGFQNGTRLNLYNGIYWNTGDGSSDPIYIPGTTTTITAPSLNVWHYYVMTCDGTSCLLYLDGVLYGQAKTVKSITGTDIWFNGWDSGGSYTLTDMAMTDFRMYSTALSADDILELYHTSASIDKGGNIYARELVE